MSKLFIALLDTLPPECIAPQTAHAMAEYAYREPTAFRIWHNTGNIIVVGTLSLEDLQRLRAELYAVPWTEPDRQDPLTSVAIQPDTEDAWRLVRRIRTRPGV